MIYVSDCFTRIPGPAAPAGMSGLPVALRIPDGPEKLSLPPNNLPVSSLIKFQLPPQRKSTVYSDPTDYLAERPPTLTTFNVTEIVVPPSVVVMALGRAHARNWQVVRAPRCFELNAPCAREKFVFKAFLGHFVTWL
ncbi:hypothetical protein DFH09DRAFT_1108349 [Mycena vulgaris]|nr:hypothetical protein DFH09DRAFT_1108349 [Mycena vulgaris]